ncbi:MAG: hypothetical protein ACR2QH_15100 [Geminicoccaceae bacterium]
MLQIAKFEQEVRAAEAAQAQRQQQAREAAELRRQMPPELQELFDVDQPTAIARRFPEPPKPGSQYKVVGTDLFDLSGDRPRLAAQGRRAGEPLERVIGPDGQPQFVKRSEAIGQTPYVSGGIQFHPDGTIKSIGGPAGQNLMRKTKTQVEADLITLGEKRQRMNQIAAGWRPQYNQILPRLNLKWSVIKDKFGALGAEDQQALGEFSVFAQDAMRNINLTIQEITGAAMGVEEAKRIMLTEPDPGQGPFGGDSPIQFKAKMDNAIYTMDLAQARLMHLHREGIAYHTRKNGGFDGISLSRMETIIEKYSDELAKSYVQRGVRPEDAEAIAYAETMQYFGMPGRQ